MLIYDSDNENKQKKLKEIAMRTQTLNKGAQVQGVEASAKEVQIIFCTRTHSQMSQIVNEIKRTQFSAEVSVVPIVSRKGLCVHESVKDLPNVSLLNERCQDLCEKSKCPYNDHDLTEIMANYILEKPQDIEEIGQYAKDTKICGYFSSRKAAQEADVLITPYQSILSESTREALGISLNNKVVVFDEGHNIMETISSMNSVSVTLPQLGNSNRAITLYTEKYGSRMAPKNLKSLRDISDVIDKLQSYIQKHKFQTETDQLQTLDVMDVLIQADLYKQDFQKISTFFDKSDLIRKINGFCTAMIQMEKQNLVQGKKQSDASNIISNSRSVLYAVKEFIRVLQYKPEDGKLIIEKQNDIMALRYLCLNPTQTLKRMLDQVKALIFISGTLEPSQEFNLLINKAKEGEVSRFNCAHIIPKQHFQGLIVSQFEDHQFDFRFQSRLNESQLKVLGSLILLTCQNTPQEGGVIVFLQSYGFKNTFLNYLRKTEFLKFLGSSRKIFEESQDGVDIFPEYQKAIIEAKAPSILFCVIGGKLSEGINFSDDLARTVIVCGLPFANSQSIEIKEKMHYYNQIGDANFTGNDYYENLCMKTLNQAIGRAIRHIGDFATIVLVDQRFSNLRIKRKLPKWMQESLIEIGAKNSRDEVQGLMTQFFKTGVLVGNHVEDRFGQELAQREKPYRTPLSEQQSRYTVGSSMFAYQFEPKTQEDLLAEKEQTEYEKMMFDIKHGTSGHLFFGHGANQDDFEKRDFGTTNQLFYEKKLKTDTLVDPHFYNTENKPLDKLQTNARIEDTPKMFGTSAVLGHTQARPYNDFTKRFDKNYNQLGLRK